MTATMWGIRVLATTRDPEQWDQWALKKASWEAEEDVDLQEWALEGLRKAIRDTAEQYVASHSGMFVCPPDVV